MEYEFYYDFLEVNDDFEVDRDVDTSWDDNWDIDVWASFEIDLGDKKYRIRITEDSSPENGESNYALKISEKKPLKIDDGFTNWRRILDKEYDNHKASGFEVALSYDIEEVTPIEFKSQQKTF